MPNISFDLGLEEYTLNEKASVVFNPTDVSFIEKVFSTFDELDKKQEAYTAAIEKQPDNAGVFEVAREMNAEMRSTIDAAFGAEICADVFGSMNIYALSGGLPVWCNLMLAVIDEMDSAFAREKKATNPRLQKYLAKYKKKK